MKPEDWVISDIRVMRSIAARSSVEEAYLSALLWYVSVLRSKE